MAKVMEIFIYQNFRGFFYPIFSVKRKKYCQMQYLRVELANYDLIFWDKKSSIQKKGPNWALSFSAIIC